MLKRLLCIIFLMIITLNFSGCSGDGRIDKAALAETVSAAKGKDGLSYSFYIISSGEKPQITTVSADSFENACSLVKKESIPNVSLAKMELMIFDDSLSIEVLERDLKYISTQAELSPLIELCLADSEALKYLYENKEAPKEFEELIALSKRQNDFVKTECLTVFNSLKSGCVSLPSISCKPELSAEFRDIYV